jgi:inorganic pyrophosphatase/exopolyphosphatase
MAKLIITGGSKAADIDILACSIAYNELQKLLNPAIDSVALIPYGFTESVTKTILTWALEYSTEIPAEESEFVIVDISNPDYLPEFVKLDKVVTVIDHHSGFESYWKEKLGENSTINLIGACATLIWEEWKKAGKAGEISQTSAALLQTAILSNTLNFEASVTSDRDRNSYAQLQRHSNLPSDWVNTYFTEQQESITKDIESAVIKDTYPKKFENLNMEIYIAQLELWDGKIMQRNLEKIARAIKTKSNRNWFFTSPVISEGKTYIMTENRQIQQLLQKALSIKFGYNLAVTNRLWLRKEIIKLIDELVI